VVFDRLELGRRPISPRSRFARAILKRRRTQQVSDMIGA
jgi:hypothetical protein